MLFDRYRLAGMDRLALPANAHGEIRKKMLALYQPQRPASSAAWAVLKRMPATVGVPGMLARQSIPSARLGSFDWQNWLQQLITELNVPDLIPAFYFPPHNDREQFSVLLLSPDSEHQFFAKVALGHEGERRLAREKAGLEFARGNCKSFRAPQALALGQFANTYYLLCEAIDTNATASPKTWSEVYAAIWTEMQSGNVGHYRLESLNWWPTVASNAAIRSVADYLLANEPEEGFMMGPAHGDFAPWNAVTLNGEMILFDWERFEAKAPRLLDPCYFAVAHAVLIQGKRQPDEIEAAVAAQLSEIQYTDRELLLAQTYLADQLNDNILKSTLHQLLQAKMDNI